MQVFVLKEARDGEKRVALVPAVAAKIMAAGHKVAIASGAGKAAGFADADYKARGVDVAKTQKSALAKADLVLAVRRPANTVLIGMKKGAGLVALMDAFDDPAFVTACAKQGVDAFAMEMVPRISRAQSMDALSSQANLAGYRAVIEGANLYNRAMPMMMTAAGTVAPAKVFVMGAGVAGLQAIATARRLGGIVTATDVRPAAKEQVASLGAKFVAVEDEEFKAAETAGGYAKQMSAEYQKKQAELVAGHIAKQDIVITTALIPGRPAPKLIDEAMVKSMGTGSVIVDMAAERGGNCTLTQAGKVAEKHGVIIAGYTNLPSHMATDTSSLYARNLSSLLPLLAGEDGAYAPHWDDEIVQGVALTRGGEIANAAFKPKAKPAVKKAPAKRAPAKKPTTKKTTARKPAAKKTPSKKAPAKKAPAKKAPAKKTATTRKKPATPKTQAKPAARKPATKKGN